jgi:hypothetical protein
MERITLCAEGKLLLASASQDKTLRIWTIQVSAWGAAGAAQQTGLGTAAQPSDLAQMIVRQDAEYLPPSGMLSAPSYALWALYQRLNLPWALSLVQSLFRNVAGMIKTVLME